VRRPPWEGRHVVCSCVKVRNAERADVHRRRHMPQTRYPPLPRRRALSIGSGSRRRVYAPEPGNSLAFGNVEVQRDARLGRWALCSLSANTTTVGHVVGFAARLSRRCEHSCACSRIGPPVSGLLPYSPSRRQQPAALSALIEMLRFQERSSRAAARHRSISVELPAHRRRRVASVGSQRPGQCRSDPAASTM
jgi:hypothetical protein